MREFGKPIPMHGMSQSTQQGSLFGYRKYVFGVVSCESLVHKNVVEARDVDFTMVLRKGPHKRLDYYRSFIALARATGDVKLAVIALEAELTAAVRGSVDVCLIRPSLEDMRQLYQRSKCFVHLSEHEGFGVPLLEAMHFDVPVLAYDSTAVPDTLGTAGVLAARKDYPLIAEMAHLLITNRRLRDAVIRQQGERVAHFRRAALAARFRAYLEELIAA